MMKKRIQNAFIVIGLVMVMLIGGFLIYASNYYKAEEEALALLEEGDRIRVQDELVIVTPPDPGDTALIFYPGAKVEHFAYLPLLDKIAQSSEITCILVDMPFNMAIFDSNVAHEIMEDFPDIEHWYIGGHSMGGAMASSYASKNQDKVRD
ncbi:alpha/beta hydrolase [Alkalibacter rhizosphaerae]|uniref:alpha/beta hydrolase n=1 Tax=Alkalibacter rhizosphaerae TaxID=2815577 RepID=UPI002112979E|nr:alpha/beta hydrolase [Alkalibacter rhizosphaerae]